MSDLSYILVILLLLGFSVFSQVPDQEIELEEVIVLAEGSILPGYEIVTIDSGFLEKHNSLSVSEILERRTVIHVRSYGAGSLASLSFRGAGSQHTNVYWNGFLLNSSMNGQYDLNLVETSVLSNLNIYPGSGSLFLGVGALGGAVNFSSDHIKKENSISATGLVASFGTYATGIGINLQKGILKSKTRLSYRQALNDFFYKDQGEPNNPEVKQKRAEAMKWSLAQDLELALNEKNKLLFHFWVQKNEQQIPAPMFVKTNDELQNDLNLRAAVSWDHKLRYGSLKIKSGYIHDQILYKNDLLKLKTNSITHSWQQVLDWRQWIHGKVQIVSTLRYNHLRAQSDEYSGKKTMDELLHLGGMHVAVHPRLLFSMFIRTGVHDNDFAPFLPSISSKWTPFKKDLLVLQASFSKNYRYPTMNERYWNPGGNENLDPENSWTAEGSITLKVKKESLFELEQSLSAFNSRIENWIQWVPGEASIWSPENLKSVWSRGIELSNSLESTIARNLKISSGFSYSFVKSTNEDLSIPNDRIIKKQLIYTPLHHGNLWTELAWKKYYISYGHRFTGRRFVNSDNSELLPTYSLAELQLGTKFQIKNVAIITKVRIDNVFGKEYQNVRNRPMPGRYYELKTTLSLNTKGK